MRESFEEYKSTIEANLINFTYLYDGDVSSSSSKETYTETISHKQVSPKIIINCITGIYNMSINKMMEKSIDYVIPSNLKDVNFNAGRHSGSLLHHLCDFQDDVGFDTKHLFTSPNGCGMFSPIKDIPSHKPFPEHFHQLQSYATGYDLYLCPIIEDNNEEVFIYAVDGSIQSLVYTIQNMEYRIEECDGLYKHTIDYDLYDCDFTCYKLIVRDQSKIRDMKIKTILNED